MTTNVDQFLTANQRSDYESIRLKVPIILRSPRTLMSLMLMITDFLSLFLAWLVVGGILLLFSHSFSQELLIEIMPFILLSQGVFALRGLYPAIGISPVNELRRLTGSTTAIFLLLAAMTFWFRNAENYSRINLALTWVFALVMSPLVEPLCGNYLGALNFLVSQLWLLDMVSVEKKRLPIY
jgi:hypothetical protein